VGKRWSRDNCGPVYFIIIVVNIHMYFYIDNALLSFADVTSTVEQKKRRDYGPCPFPEKLGIAEKTFTQGDIIFPGWCLASRKRSIAGSRFKPAYSFQTGLSFWTQPLP